MAQYARPSSDVAVGLWYESTGDTQTSIYADIAESVRDDNDYIYSQANQTTECQIGLSSVTDPSTGTGHTVRYVYRRTKTNKSLTLVVTLHDGSTSTDIASWTHADPAGTLTLAEQSLSEAQANNIDSYADLELHFNVTVNGGGGIQAEVSWAEVEVPDAGGTTYYQSCAGTLTPSGSPSKGTATDKAGTLPLAGALARAVSTALAGTLGSSGVLNRKTATSTDGAITPSGDATGAFTTSQAAAGAITPSGVAAAIAKKLLGGSLPTTGTLSRNTGKNTAGALPLAGALARLSKTDLAGSLGLTGALATALQFIEACAGSLGLSGTLSNLPKKSNDGSLGLAGGLARGIKTALAGTLGPSGALSTAATWPQGTAGSLAFSGSLGTDYTAGGGGPTVCAHGHWSWGGWD